MAFAPAESSTLDVRANYFVVINRGRLLCESDSPWRPLGDAFVNRFGKAAHQHYLGTLDGQHCSAVFFNQKDPPEIPGYHWRDLRSQLGLVTDEYFQLAGRALQITRWYREHQYCGVCGSKTREATSDRALVCKNCNMRFYPRISPCVIGLVKRDNMCLLARGIHHPDGIYSTLAGFVEPGESAEQAFSREVLEEVGIKVKNVRYFGSQPWPFPGQLMLGYNADYVSGDIQKDLQEIIDARWFTPETLPRTPPTSTIAGRLIRDFVERTEG